MGKFTFLSYLFFLFVLLELVGFSTVYSQTKVYGKIIDAETKETLPFVNVVFDKNEMGVASDIDGNYSISTSAHVDSIRAFFLGYDTKVFAVKPGTIQEIDFTMNTSKISLATVVVSASAEDPAILLFKRIVDNKFHNNKEKFTMFSDQIITPTFIDDIALVIDKIIEKKPQGLYHCVGSTSISPYNLAINIAKTFNLNKSLIKPSSLIGYIKANPNSRPRQKNLTLSNKKLQKELGINMLTLDESLEKIKNQQLS